MLVEQKTMKIEQIEIGQLFEYENHLFLRIDDDLGDNSFDEPISQYVNLNTNYIESFFSSIEVKPLKMIKEFLNLLRDNDDKNDRSQ